MTTHSGHGWRLAPSLVAAESEADRIAPRRSRASDGSIGDSAHRARPSDHNPSGGFVHALDLTHDPRGGFDAHAHVRNIAARRDPRVKYLISNGQIWQPRTGWKRYTGINPHRAHAHISVLPSSTGRHDTSPWFGAVIPFPTPTPPPPPPKNRPAPAATTDPDEEDTPMIMRAHHTGETWLYDGGGLVRSHVPTEGHIKALMQLGVPFDDVSGNVIYSQVLLEVTRDIDAV